MASLIYKDVNVSLKSYRVRLPATNVPRAVTYYKEALERLIHLAQAHDIRLIMGLQPLFTPAGFDELQRLMNELQMSIMQKAINNGQSLRYYEARYYIHSLLLKAIVEVAEKYGISVVDCGQFLPVDKHDYYIDQVHLNAQGTPFVAQALFQYLSSSTSH